MTKRQYEQLRQAVKKATGILGCPIRVADVLMMFYLKPLNGIEIFAAHNWDLAKALDGQSDETKQFLWELLCEYEKRN